MYRLLLSQCSGARRFLQDLQHGCRVRKNGTWLVPKQAAGTASGELGCFAMVSAPAMEFYIQPTMPFFRNLVLLLHITPLVWLQFITESSSEQFKITIQQVHKQI